MKKVESKDLKISSTANIKKEYWVVKAEQQKRWKEQDSGKK